MDKYTFGVGDTYKPKGFGGSYIAGIHVTTNNKTHNNRIKIYGSTCTVAENLRDIVLNSLHDNKEAAFQAGRDSVMTEIKKLLE